MVFSKVPHVGVSVVFIVESAYSMEGVVSEMSAIVGSIGENEEAIFASGHASHEPSFKKDTIFAVNFARSMRPSVAPFSIVVASWHGVQLIDGKFLSAFCRSP
jgi:hypothetical protein